mgnify:CR=1 FL=1
MPLKPKNPITPGMRDAVLPTFEELTEKRPKKSLLKSLKRNAGRGSDGKISVRHRGGGSKRKLRIIDFKRDKAGVPGKVHSIEYDPNRSCRIALIKYNDGDWRYILAPNRIEIGDIIESGEKAEINIGNALPLKSIPTGSTVHNIELIPGKGGQIVRSAGGSAQVLAHEGIYSLIRLPSGEVRKILSECTASIGQIGNLDHKNRKLGKAGRKRNMGWRPTVARPGDQTHHLHGAVGIGRIQKDAGGGPKRIRTVN